MFGHASQPSRIFSYGAKVPTDGATMVDAQMELARRYRNALVRVERRRRDRVEAAMLDLQPELRRIETAIAAAQAARDTARKIIDCASAAARRKTYAPGAAEAARAASEKLAALWRERKVLRKAAFASEAWKPIGEGIDALALARAKRLYHAAGRAGLGWGTRLHVGTTVDRSGAPPQFSRRDGGGHLAVQIQHGISPAEAFAGGDTRVRIDPLPIEEPPDFIGPRLSKAAMRRTTVRLRLSSEDDRSPIFAAIPVVLHRPMPADAQIKWVHLIRRRIATHHEWCVQFVLSRAKGWDKEDRAKEGAVSIDVGWRVTGDDGKTPRPDGSMRVAYWKGTDGAEGELALPKGWLDGMRKTEDIRSIRDEKLFNPVRERLSAWIANAPAVPQWLRDRAATLPQWRSAARLAALAVHWRSNRFAGDEQAFAEIEAWRKRDKHLYEYEGNLRDQLQARRLDIYRNFAADMRRRYKTARIEKLDLRDFHRLPESEGTPVDGALKEHVRDACISQLFACLGESFGNTDTVKVNPKWTTAKCNVCGSIQKWNRKVLRHRCTACGAEWDQDENATENIGA